MLRIPSSRMPYFVISFAIPVLYPVGTCLAVIGALCFFGAGAWVIATAPPADRVLGYEEFASSLTSTNSLIALALLKVYCLDLLLSPEEPNGETACWGHYFNDFMYLLSLL